MSRSTSEPSIPRSRLSASTDKGAIILDIGRVYTRFVRLESLCTYHTNYDFQVWFLWRGCPEAHHTKPNHYETSQTGATKDIAMAQTFIIHVSSASRSVGPQVHQ